MASSREKPSRGAERTDPRHRRQHKRRRGTIRNGADCETILQEEQHKKTPTNRRRETKKQQLEIFQRQKLRGGKSQEKQTEAETSFINSFHFHFYFLFSFPLLESCVRENVGLPRLRFPFTQFTAHSLVDSCNKVLDFFRKKTQMTRKMGRFSGKSDRLPRC